MMKMIVLLQIQYKEKNNKTINSHAVLIGLDKITAKSSKIQVNLMK